MVVGTESTKALPRRKVLLWLPVDSLHWVTRVYLNNYQPVLPVLHSTYLSKNLSKLFFYHVFLQPLVQQGFSPRPQLLGKNYDSKT